MVMKLGLIGLGLLGVGIASALAVSIASKSQGTTVQPMATQDGQAAPGSKTIVVAGGCFWCVEAIYEELKGVSKVESGYAGGTIKNPTYEQVCSGATGHAEAVRITYDPKVISEDDLLHIFFTTHDPTTPNRQGNDVGTQYRSAVFYTDDEEKKLAQKVIDDVNAEKIWPSPIVTTLEPLKEFYLAESYHQDYFNKYENATDAQKMEMNSGYCRAVIEPKVRKFRAKYADRLKK